MAVIGQCSHCSICHTNTAVSLSAHCYEHSSPRLSLNTGKGSLPDRQLLCQARLLITAAVSARRSCGGAPCLLIVALNTDITEYDDACPGVPPAQGGFAGVQYAAHIPGGTDGGGAPHRGGAGCGRARAPRQRVHGFDRRQPRPGAAGAAGLTAAWRPLRMANQFRHAIDRQEVARTLQHSAVVIWYIH